MSRRGRTKRALLAAGLALSLAACGDPPETGTVTNKVYTEPWTSFTMHCAAYNQQHACTSWFTTPVYHPADWSVCLRADAQDTSHDRTGCWSVNQHTYDSVRVGQQWSRRAGA